MQLAFTALPQGFAETAAVKQLRTAAYKAALAQNGVVSSSSLGVFLNGPGGGYLFVPGPSWAPTTWIRTPSAPPGVAPPSAPPPATTPPPTAPGTVTLPAGYAPPPYPPPPPAPPLPAAWMPLPPGLAVWPIPTGAKTINPTASPATAQQVQITYQSALTCPTKVVTAQGVFFRTSYPGAPPFILFAPNPTWSAGSAIVVPFIP